VTCCFEGCSARFSSGSVSSWTVFQRSNLVKNPCLFGVCIHLTQHEHGRYSVDSWLERQKQAGISL